MKDFQGRTAFVTGGASGIGLGLAQALLAEGMNVAIADRDEAMLQAAVDMLDAGDKLIALPLDVTDRAAFAAARDATLAAFGSVNLLCNNAGVGGGAPIDQADFVDWDWMLGVNLGGVINGVVTFLPSLKEAGDAHILNTSSMAGLFVAPGAAFGIYTVGKVAVRGLTESLRWSLADSGVGVTALCPGYVKTGIAKTGRLHPLVLSGERETNGELEAMVDGFMQQVGIEPSEAAQIAIAAIRKNQLYAITHGEFAPAAAEYSAILADAFSHAPVRTGDNSAADSVGAIHAVRLAEQANY